MLLLLSMMLALVDVLLLGSCCLCGKLLAATTMNAPSYGRAAQSDLLAIPSAPMLSSSSVMAVADAPTVLLAAASV